MGGPFLALVKRRPHRESWEMNNFRRVLSAVLLGSFATYLVGATPANPYLRMLKLEQRRSLGAGELAAYLQSSDEDIAARAALAIGRTRKKAGAELLRVHATTDPRAAVRALSIYGLGLIGLPRDGALFVSSVGDVNGAVQVAAIDAIDRLQTAQHLGNELQSAETTLSNELRNAKDPILRAHAAEALEAFSVTARVTQTARRALRSAVQNDADSRVRRTAMWSLFRGFAKTASHRFFRLATADRDEVVRIEAVRALGSRGDARDAKLLVQIMHKDPSWRVQEQAGESLRLVTHQAMTDHWKSIPRTVHLPKRMPDALDALPALARTPALGKLTAPIPDDALLDEPRLDPSSARRMDGPAPGLHPRMRIVTTEGNVYVMLMPEWAPLTVANFMNLANRGYYDKNPWFRVVPDFVVQTGDPKGNGDGDAGFFIPAEENPIMQYSGVLSMGLNYTKNAPDRDSAGTQYYITLSPQLHLDRDFTVFGRVVGGSDVLAHITEHDSVIRVERIADIFVQ